MSSYSKECVRGNHYYEMLNGRVFSYCLFCHKDDPNFEIKKLCRNHFSIFNLFKMRCSEHCRNTVREAQ